jgi:hypothetical protein
MAEYPIRIVGTIPARFVPDQGKPCHPLRARLTDRISWGNDTKAIHHPWPTKENGEPLTEEEIAQETLLALVEEPIQPGRASPLWPVTKSKFTGNIIFYCCKRHEGEFGSIVIVE